MKVFLSLFWCVLIAMLMWTGTSKAGEIGPNKPRAPVFVAQKTDDASSVSQGAEPREYPLGGTSVEDLLLQKGTITMDEWIQIRAEQEYRVADQSRRIDSLEEWKNRTELLPILRDKVNFGLKALHFPYSHLDAQVPEGRSQDGFSIRRSELLFWGKISETIPRWHILMEFQSINLTNNTPTSGASTPTSATFFRETYIDLRPVQAWAPNLNVIRMGIFRMPFGIFTETSGGLRDVISSPYLTSVGSGTINRNGSNPSVGTIEFIHERDYFADVRGTLFNRVEYVGGIMNNNNFEANAVGANGPKVGYGSVRFPATDISFISFTMLAGESNNTNTQINGRGKGA